MIYRKTPHEDGRYTDEQGQRWEVDCCRRIRTKEGVNIGWTEFPTLEEALKEWGLREVDPT